MAGPQAAGTAGGSPQHTPNDLGLDFEDAARPSTKARIALNGPSGAGKTYSALSIATGMGSNIGVIDTERGSAANYAGLFTFKHLRMPNTRPQTLIQALAVAAQRGIDVVIIDSMTHFWSGKGGILDQVDSTTSSSQSRNAFTTGWKKVKPVEQEMWEAILSFPGHVIVTIRVKTAYEIQETSTGKKEPVKIGLKPDQREGADYEFDLVGDLNLQHVMRVSKSRYPGTIDVNDEVASPDTELGQAIVAWLDEGVSMPSVQDYVDVARAPETSREELLRLYQQELPKRGLLGAALIDPGSGRATTLGAIVLQEGLVRKQREEAVLAEARAAAAQAAAEAAAAQAPQAPAPEATQAVARDTSALLQTLGQQVAAAWNSLPGMEAVLATAVAQALVEETVPGPDEHGTPIRVGTLIQTQIDELKNRQAQTGGTAAVYDAAGTTPNQQTQQRGAA